MDMDTTEATLKAGDVCLDCQQLGSEKYLRYFKINLNGDTLLKCESNECMYPYNDEMYSSDEEEQSIDNDVMETNGVQFIDDFIKQCTKEEKLQNLTNDPPKIEESNVSEQVVQFDITFLDDLNGKQNEGLCKIEIPEDNNFNNEVIENKYFSLPNLQYEMPPPPSAIVITNDGNKETNDNEIGNFNFTNDCKPKINIQSIETIKLDIPIHNHIPTPSKIVSTFNNDTSPTNSYTSNTPAVTQVATLTSNETAVNSKNVKSSSKVPNLKKYKSKKKIQDLCHIPKADIIKGNALLKSIAEGNNTNKLSEVGRKTKPHRYKRMQLQEEELEQPLINTGTNYNLDKLSEILLGNKKTFIHK